MMVEMIVRYKVSVNGGRIGSSNSTTIYEIPQTVHGINNKRP